MTSDRAAAHAALMDHLAVVHHGEHGPVPCLAWPHGGWTSEDAAEQQLVAKLCHACPALTECQDYIDTNPEPSGVWAGRTETDRRPRRERRPKQQEMTA